MNYKYHLTEKDKLRELTDEEFEKYKNWIKFLNSVKIKEPQKTKKEKRI